MWALPVVEYLGLNPRYIDGTMIGGSSFIAHLLPAMHAHPSGQCSAVLVCYGSAQRSAAFGRREIVAARRFLDPQPYEHPYEPMLPVSAYALAASRHMHAVRHHARAAGRSGRRRTRLGAAEPGSLHARAAQPRATCWPSRMVSDPLTVRDCCLVTDGGGAWCWSAPSAPATCRGSPSTCWATARRLEPADLLHAGPDGHGAGQSGRAAFAMAGLRRRTSTWCSSTTPSPSTRCCSWKTWASAPRAKAGASSQDGAIAPGGTLPVNTNGGGLSCVHPGMYGIFALIEAVRQLRGEAASGRWPARETAIAHGNGGMLSSQATAILGTAEAL